MLMSLNLAAWAAIALGSSTLGGPGLTLSEVRLLVELGVTEPEIVATAERHGGFAPADSAELTALEHAGASRRLLAMFPHQSDDLDRLRELARHYRAHEDRERGVSFIYPEGWMVTRQQVGNLTTLYRVTPDAAPEGKLFLDAALFVVVQPRTTLVPDASEPVLARLEKLALDRLLASSIIPTLAEPLMLEIVGLPVPCRRIEAAPDPRKGVGVFGVALRVLPDGTALGIGYTAGVGDRATTEAAAVQLARTLTRVN